MKNLWGKDYPCLRSTHCLKSLSQISLKEKVATFAYHSSLLLVSLGIKSLLISQVV